jgi:hypothetical protein
VERCASGDKVIVDPNGGGAELDGRSTPDPGVRAAA